MTKQKRQRKVRHWSGNAPSGSLAVAHTTLSVGFGAQLSTFTLYARNRSGAEYVNFKLVADRAPRKANWWLTWAVNRQRFTPNGDAGVLATNPEQLALYGWVRAVAAVYIASGQYMDLPEHVPGGKPGRQSVPVELADLF